MQVYLIGIPLCICLDCCLSIVGCCLPPISRCQTIVISSLQVITNMAQLLVCIFSSALSQNCLTALPWTPLALRAPRAPRVHCNPPSANDRAGIAMSFKIFLHSTKNTKTSPGYFEIQGVETELHLVHSPVAVDLRCAAVACLPPQTVSQR